MTYLEYIKAFANIKYEQIRVDLNHKKTEDLDATQKRLLHELNLFGVAVLPDYYSPEKCDLIRNEIDSMIEDENVNKWYDEAKSDSRVFASHQHSDNIRSFYEDSFLRKIGEAYTKTELVNSHTLGARLVPKENNLGSGGGWHRDSVYQIQYKSIAYLSDVNDDNGPFEYLLGSHKKSSILKSIVENNFSAHHNRITEQEIEEFKKSNPSMVSKIFTAKKGSVLLVDTSGIHRGTPIQNGARYALTNYFFLKHHYTPKARARFEKHF